MKNALILLAGGEGKRLKSRDPKQFLRIGGTSLIEYFLSNLEKNVFDVIIIAVTPKNREKYLKTIKKKFYDHNIKFSLAAKTRQLSSKNALEYLSKFKPKNVLIHDSARPLASNLLIKRIIKGLKNNISCIPYVTHNDLLKIKNNVNIKNSQIHNIQTPQGFDFINIYKAYKNEKKIDAKDDSSILEIRGIKLNMIKGEILNIKITKKEDLKNFDIFRKREFRSGIGYDIHQIDPSSKKKLTLCGVKINHPPLIGHSDADVGYHAICDSILGSLSMKDIGFHFNNKDLKWKNADSKIFIKFCYNQLLEKGYKIVNLDINFICEKPNINKISFKMKKNLIKLLKINQKQISIKATTNEKIGFIGRGEAIAAESIIQIVNV